MQLTHKIIGIFSLITLALCFAVLPKLEKTTENKDLYDLVGFDVEGLDGTHRIKIIKEEGIYYVFLPAYTNPEKVKVNINGNINVTINGSKVKNNGYINVTELGEEAFFVLSDKRKDEVVQGKMIFMISKNLPAVYLTTKSGTMDYINSKKGNRESGYIEVMSEEGKKLYSNKVDKLGGRGNTSWEVPKKSYNMVLHSKAGLLGMPDAKKWILISNYYDGAFIRNKLGFQLADEAGLAYTPDSRFIDLYINGKYWGLYQLTERIESDPNRINIGDGYLMEIDYPERAVYEDNVIYLENGQPIVIHSPKKVTDDQILFLETWYNDMLEALYSEDYVNYETGKYIFEYLDKESFARMYLIEEILEDLDMGVTSHYMYMGSNADSRLYDGPVWDLDNTMGRGYDKRYEFFANNQSLSSNQISRWYARLCGNEEFQEAVLKAWKEYISPAMENITQNEIDNLIYELGASIAMDEKRWTGPRSRFMPQADLDANVEFLEKYMQERFTFLDNAFTENEESTLKLMEDRAAALPVLEKLEEYQPSAENEDSDMDREIKNEDNIMGSHGFVLFLIMLVEAGILVLLDRKRNGRINGN